MKFKLPPRDIYASSVRTYTCFVSCYTWINWVCLCFNVQEVKKKKQRNQLDSTNVDHA